MNSNLPIIIRSNLLVFLAVLFLQSCVVHSSPPFICFVSKCVQEKNKNRAIAMKVKRGKNVKIKSRKSKGEIAKVSPKQKKGTAKETDGVKNWSQ
jgi:hypothetical protein